MAKFKFQLESVLFQRKIEEEQCQRGLAKHLRQRMILRDQLRQMQQTISDSRRDLADGLVGAVDLDRISHFARYSGQARQRAHTFVAKLAGVEKQVHQARHELMNATRARKAMELLRDQKFQKWKQHIERREAIELDELAVQRHARRIIEEGVA